MVYDLLVIDALFLEQTVRSNITDLSVSHTLDLVSEINESIKPQQISQSLLFDDRIVVNKTLHLSVAHTLVLTQEQHPRVYDESVSHILILAQDINDQNTVVHSFLELEQVIDVMVSKNITSELELTQEIGLSVVHNLTVAHTIVIGSAANGYLADKCFINGDFTLEGP